MRPREIETIASLVSLQGRFQFGELDVKQVGIDLCGSRGSELAGVGMHAFGGSSGDRLFLDEPLGFLPACDGAERIEGRGECVLLLDGLRLGELSEQDAAANLELAKLQFEKVEAATRLG